ncbi:hypothetical protein [Paracoccus sp. pheM1]|uniref:hypothetical protein n=1 Tax=Paracoccus sp. pheM1 TaxID=2831675 RepID=UPI001BDB90EB|nr:hypothetical protein [Paracoccus sp. pheM1]MBT0778069.1 hypothetical protein [Paracoccus sp. pheM1]
MTCQQIVFPGTSFIQFGLPQNIRYVPGTELPSAGALGVFLLDDGEVNSWHDGDFANLVPGSMPGRVLPGWSPPQMRNFGSARGGMRITNVNGTLIDSRIPAQRSQFTVAMLVYTHAKHGSPSPYNLIHLMTSDSANAMPADNTGNLNMLGANAIWGIGASMNTGKVGQFMRYGPAISLGGANFTEMAATLGVQGQWNAFAMSVDGPAGAIRFQTLTDYRTISDAEQGNTEIYDTWVTNLAQRNGTFLFGCAVNGPNRDSEGPLADMMGAGFYGPAYSASGIEALLRGLAKIGVDRGVTVAGY